MTRLSLVALSTLAFTASGEIYFQEKFDKGWKDRWVESVNWKPAAELGKWEETPGKWYGDAKDKGIQVSSSSSSSSSSNTN